MAFNSGRTDVDPQVCPLQVMRGIQTRSAADVARELDISLGSAQNCVRPTGTEQCVHTGCHRIPQMMKKLIVWVCMGLSCILWTCYTDQREQFWS